MSRKAKNNDQFGFRTPRGCPKSLKCMARARGVAKSGVEIDGDIARRTRQVHSDGLRTRPHVSHG